MNTLPIFSSQPRLPSIAIVILNWNGRHHLEKFLPSVLAARYPNKRIIVADNGSTDDSLAFLTANYLVVEQIRLEKNFGFAQGYNEALKQVEADYFLLLNSDVEVKPDFLEPLLNLMEGQNQIAACQPKILSYTNKNMFEYAGAAGGWLDAYGYPFARGRIFDICEEDRGQYDFSEPIFWASGAALFIRASAYREMGGFDNYFFAHQEEIDLCWRLQLAGYKIYSCPQSVVYHVGGGTLPKGNSLKTYLNFRNNLIMMYKNMPWREKWWKLPYRQLLNGLSAYKGLFSGDAGYFQAIIRAHTGFVKWWLLRQKKSLFPAKTKAGLQGYYRGNVVWQHFVKRRTRFDQIISRDEGNLK